MIAGSPSKRQQVFTRFFTGVLVDLTVLNLFDEHWGYVAIGSFTISLLAAVLLETLLRVTIRIEHRVAAYFKAQPGVRAKVLRVLSAWGILFSSKLVILEAINFSFGDRVVFSGPLHGVVAFIVVVIAIVLAELAVSKMYRSLA